VKNMKNYTTFIASIVCAILLLGLVVACDEPAEDTGGESEEAAPNFCLELDGDGDFVSIAHHDAFDLGAQWTVECWAVLDDNSAPRPLVRKGGAQVDTASFYVYGNSSDDVATAGYRINQLNSVHQVSTADTLGAEVWHHLALVNDGTRLMLYVDGLTEGSCPTDAEPLVADDSELVLGANLRQELFLVGKLDEVRISSTARYDADFEPAERFEIDPQTLALWHFDEGEGAGVFDEVLGLRGDLIGDVTFLMR
jgi:hypothetical protein